MFAQKCELLLMYRIQANLDEKAVVFLPRKSFLLPLRLGKKKLSVFYYNFSLGKHNKKLRCRNKHRHRAYLLLKDQENTLSCFRDIANLKFFFFTPSDNIPFGGSVLSTTFHLVPERLTKPNIIR